MSVSPQDGRHYMPGPDAMLSGRLAATLAREPAGRPHSTTEIAIDATLVAVATLAIEASQHDRVSQAQHVRFARAILAVYGVRIMQQGGCTYACLSDGKRIVLLGASPKRPAQTPRPKRV